MTDLYHAPLAAVTKAAKKAPGPMTIRAPGTDDHWTWTDGWQGAKGEPPKSVEVPDTYWAPPEKKMPKRPAPAKDVVHELEKIMAWWRRLYHDGILSSNQANSLAGQTALIDRDGTVWTVGIASGDWYRFDGSWTKTDAPDPDTIIDADAAISKEDDVVVQGLARFFQKVDDTAPERVTKEWAVPT